jgi:hypothetical protein
VDFKNWKDKNLDCICLATNDATSETIRFLDFDMIWPQKNFYGHSFVKENKKWR